MIKKKIEDLTEQDLLSYSVWEYIDDSSGTEILVSPAIEFSTHNIDDKLISTKIALANGKKIPVILGNINPESAKLTKHFITLSMPIDKKWFTLSRYHDKDYELNGPQAMANLLEMSVKDVFPITYDISHILTGDSNALKNTIDESPCERLSREELIRLAVPS